MTRKEDIFNILKKEGPQASSELREILMKKFDLSYNSATQSITRSGSSVKKIKGWFPKNETYLFLDEHKESSSFKYKFYEKLISKKSSHGIALASIIARGGIISEPEFHCITGSPYFLSKQTSGDKLKNDLLDQSLIEEREVPLLSHSLVVSPQIYDAEKESFIKARLMTEEVFIVAIKDWLERNGYVADNLTKYRGRNSAVNRKVGQFSWDIGAASYLRPLTQIDQKGKKPGFVVCDILLTRNVSKRAILAFVKKVEILEKTSNSGPAMPIFIASHFKKEAFVFGKSKGILITTPKNLFGEETSKALINISQLLQRTLSDITPGSIEGFIKKTVKYYETFSTLKGFSFELICAYLSNYELSGSISLQKNIYVDGIQKEVDVMKVEGSNKSVTFIEAKSKEKGNLVSAEEIRIWKEKTDVINRWLKLPENYQFRETKINHEIWTNTDFNQEAKKELEKIKSNVRKKYYSSKNGKQILKISTQSKSNKGISDVLRLYFNLS